MIVQVGKEKYRIRFQYAPPQITRDKTGRIVSIDNSKRSTLCELKRIEPEEGPLFFGIAATDKKGRDQFNRKAGRRIALDRALGRYADHLGLKEEQEHSFFRRIKQEVYKKMDYGEAGKVFK